MILSRHSGDSGFTLGFLFFFYRIEKKNSIDYIFARVVFLLCSCGVCVAFDNIIFLNWFVGSLPFF